MDVITTHWERDGPKNGSKNTLEHNKNRPRKHPPALFFIRNDSQNSQQRAFSKPYPILQAQPRGKTHIHASYYMQGTQRAQKWPRITKGRQRKYSVKQASQTVSNTREFCVSDQTNRATSRLHNFFHKLNQEQISIPKRSTICKEHNEPKKGQE